MTECTIVDEIWLDVQREEFTKLVVDALAATPSLLDELERLFASSTGEEITND